MDETAHLASNENSNAWSEREQREGGCVWTARAMERNGGCFTDILLWHQNSQKYREEREIQTAVGERIAFRLPKMRPCHQHVLTLQSLRTYLLRERQEDMTSAKLGQR